MAQRACSADVVADTAETPLSCRVAILRLSLSHRSTAVWRSNCPPEARSSSNPQNTMRTSMDYTKLAASLDYAALEKKLTQLSERKR